MLSVIGITGVIMAETTTNFKNSPKHVAESGNLARGVFSTVPTAQAFGTQVVLSNPYSTFIDKVLKALNSGGVRHMMASLS
ncbi:hypothetical protein P691DRAFT_764892 [Macrolepiota fuliginosa MF-IS2]|uniref:Uncharacterized protein n=1 Tax=Macrolepiota fuliginosa MF-IS2 TaxID=1400762 RepID=A0A9P5X1I3_9AGAR|nr:hypothetical protein P691DRAFT_764892 [Macrolepiota fuliginosa MF-IS2]